MSDSDDELLFLCASAYYCISNYKIKKRKRAKRRWWVRNFLSKKNSQGAYQSLMNDLRIEDRQGFKNFVRMTPADFEILLNMVAPHIVKQDTKFRVAVSPAEQLAVTLRFLASGDSYASLMYLHRISKSKISSIVPTVCEAIFEVLQHYIKVRKKQTKHFKHSFI